LFYKALGGTRGLRHQGMVKLAPVRPVHHRKRLIMGHFRLGPGFPLSQKSATLGLIRNMPLAGQDFVPTSCGLESMM
jgi:hypothetical protein